MTLNSIFDRLETPVSDADELVFSAHPIPQYSEHRVAKNRYGRPTILICTAENDKSASLAAPIRLERLQVLPDMRCQVELSSGLREIGFFTVVICTSPEKPLQEYFLHVMESILAVLGPAPTRKEVADSIIRLVDLFRSLSSPARKSIRGLWAELLLIELASDAATVLGCWHQSPLDRYDFSDGLQRVEVKSSTTRARKHHFSFEQANPPSDTTVLIVSMYVEPDAGGLSVLDLAQRIKQRISQPSLVFHLESTMAEILGRDSEYVSEHRFDYQLAKDSLRVFLASDIPAIRGKIPPEVSEVKFVTDLSRSFATDIKSYCRYGGVFEALWGDWDSV